MKKTPSTLAGVTQWIERQPATQRVAVQFPVRVHSWVAGQVPGGGLHERQPHIAVSLPLSPSLPLCLKINK